MSKLLSALAGTVVGTLFLVGSPSLAEINPSDIVKRADRSRGFEADHTFSVEVTEFAGPKTLRSTKYKIYNKGLEATLVNTLYPPRQKNRKLLMQEDSLWFYTPDIKRATRVSLQQRLTGEVANGDLARANFRNDYSSKIVGEELLYGRKVWKLDLKANTKNVTYNGIIYWVEKETFLPVQAYFLTSSGKILKKCQYVKTSDILGRKLVTEIKIVDALQPHRFSVLKYSNFKKETLNSALFNKDSLGNE